MPVSPAALKPKPLVSIGMPVYNGAKFICNALDSLLAQTFTNFELIISDNASTDNTEAICKRYSESDSRIRYVRQIVNLGAIGNFQYVLDEAVGEYFMWAAYDDLRSPEFIDVLVKKLIENKDYSSAFGVFSEIDDSGKLLRKDIILNFSGEAPLERICKYWLDFRSLRDVWIYGLHQRSALKKMRLMPWAWVNRDNPLNGAHPVLTFMLAQGKYYFINNKVIFFRRVLQKGSLWTKDLKNSGFIWRELKYLILKVNLIIRSVKEVVRGSKSIRIGFLSFFCISLNVIQELSWRYLGAMINKIKKAKYLHRLVNKI